MEWRDKSIPDNLKLLWDIIMMAFIWIIWRERNDRLFKATANNFSFLINSILFFSNLWAGHFPLVVKKQVPVIKIEEFGVVAVVSTSRGTSDILAWVDALLPLVGTPASNMSVIPVHPR